MADAGDRPSRDRADLITCVLSREDGRWYVTWVSDGSTPEDDSDDDLAVVIDRAEAGVADIYGDKPDISGDEFQYAIYPWENYRGNVILEIKESPGGYEARDEVGGAYVQGSSLEELILEAERRLPNSTNEIMFHWIVPITELFEADDERAEAGGLNPLEVAAAVGKTLGTSGIAVTTADIVAIMNARAELTGRGDLETDPVGRNDAIARAATATGRRPDTVARIYDEMERYLSIRQSVE